MLYALTRSDGSVAITTVMPTAVVVDGETLPVQLINSPAKFLMAGDRTFPLPSDDVRTYETNSVPGATLTFPAIEDEIAKMSENYASSAKITVADMPTTRAYRNAWAVSGTKVGYDMPKARDIHRDKLRETRKPLMEALDIAYQRADEQDDGPKKREIAAEKQKLRDITANQLIERANNIAALETLTVEYLLAHP